MSGMSAWWHSLSRGISSLVMSTLGVPSIDALSPLSLHCETQHKPVEPAVNVQPPCSFVLANNDKLQVFNLVFGINLQVCAFRGWHHFRKGKTNNNNAVIVLMPGLPCLRGKKGGLKGDNGPLCGRADLITNHSRGKKCWVNVALRNCVSLKVPWAVLELRGIDHEGCSSLGNFKCDAGWQAQLSYGVNKATSIDVAPPQSDADSFINAGTW